MIADKSGKSPSAAASRHGIVCSTLAKYILGGNKMVNTAHWV